MSVTQYIGARYVPLFADPLTWDITKAYEALTIVYYQGNSFTSRQAVPAGIDITNTDYWALTGNYNAQVEQYRAEVQAYDGRITANTNSNTAQDAQLAGTSSSGLKTLIDTNANDIDALEQADTAIAAQLAGTSASGLKTLIDANASDIDALELADAAHDAQLAGTSSSGLKTLIDTNASDIDAIEAKLAPLAQLSNAPLFMVPTYVGDYMINEQFGCVAHHADTFYCFNTGNYDNTGELRIFSEATNALALKKRIQVGHANSCAFDTVRSAFWIAPHMTYSGGVATYVTDLYRYDTTLSVLQVVQTGANNTVFAVSFDAKRNVLCAYDRTGNILTCFEMAADESAFTQAWTVDLTSYTASAWQDVFCWDGLSYLLLPEGTVFVVDSSGTIVGSGEVDNVDDNNYWRFGEHEGWECDAAGTLYMARNGNTGITLTGDTYPVNNAFVTAVSFGTKTKEGTFTRNAPYPTATLSSEAQAKFKLGNAQLRSLNQLNFIVHNFACVTILANDTVVEEYDRVRLPSIQPISILILGSYELLSVIMTGGDYTFYVGSNGTLKVNATDYFLALNEYSAPTFRLRVRGTLTFSGTQLIHPTYSLVKASIIAGSTPIVYHGTTIPANGIAEFLGTTLIYKSWS